MTVNAIVTRGYGPTASVGISRIVRRGYHSYVGLIDVPDAGRRFLVAGPPSYGALSIFDDANSDVGNVADIPLVWTPSGAALGMESDGLPYATEPTTGRQEFEYREFDITALAYVPVTDAVDGITAVYYAENQPPEQTAEIEAQAWFANFPITPVILGDYVQDPDDPEHLLEPTGTLPPGLTFEQHTYNPGEPNERTVWQIEGTPTTPSSGFIQVSVTDVPGVTVDLDPFAYTILAAILVPTVDEGATLMAAGLAEFAAAGLAIVALTPELNAAAPGIIFDQFPEGGEMVIPATECILYVSGVTRPDTLGMDRTAAIAAITAAGLVANVDLEYSGSVPFDEVFAQSPDSEGVMLPGSVVTITASLGVFVEDPVPVRATSSGWFAGEQRAEGDVFYITAPEHYSPYWMEFVTGVPVSWTSTIRVYSRSIDLDLLGHPIDLDKIPQPFRDLLAETR